MSNYYDPWPEDEIEEFPFTEDDENESRDRIGCLFPGRCVAADPVHFESECATAEMMDEMYEAGEL